MKYKTGLIRCLLDRLNKICSSEQQKEIEDYSKKQDNILYNEQKFMKNTKLKDSTNVSNIDIKERNSVEKLR